MADVIRKLKQKTPDGFSKDIHLGALPQYVGALRQSNVRNLEEQYILGVNCITTEYFGKGLENFPVPDSVNPERVVIKEFRGENVDKDYYKLTVYFFDKQSEAISFDNNQLILDNDNNNSDYYYKKQIEILSYIDKNGNEDENNIFFKKIIRDKKDSEGIMTITETMGVGRPSTDLLGGDQ